jgi:hypothetical protein
MSVQAAFRERMITEMDRRGLTDAGLAQKASKYHPMTANTIWKIRNADPPRRIDIDEAQAILRALEYENLESLLDATGLYQVMVDFADLVHDGLLMFTTVRSATEQPGKLKESIARLGTNASPPAVPPRLVADLREFLNALESGLLSGEIELSISRLEGYRDDLRDLITSIEALGWKE